MKNKIVVIILFLVFSILPGCTLSHEFGPYYGKVIEAETGKPIEGAVIVLIFSRKIYALVEMLSQREDVFEVMTDSNGEFNIPPHKITRIRPLSRWDKHVHIIVFKPGYGSYPWNMSTRSEPEYTPKWTLLQDKHVTIILPKLKTIKERKRNLRKLWLPSHISEEKTKEFIRLQEIEENNIKLGR